VVTASSIKYNFVARDCDAQNNHGKRLEVSRTGAQLKALPVKVSFPVAILYARH